MTPQQQRSIATILYADVFDYPMTREELAFWMIGGSAFRLPSDVRSIVRSSYRGQTYILPARRIAGIRRRGERMRVSLGKWQTVYRIISLFRWVPTVRLIGVTGGLAVNNAAAQDDIDLFFVTDAGCLWATRLVVTLIADVFGIRRKPGSSDVTNKICLNMFMSGDALKLPESERDLFSAHEVLQMVPVWDRGGAYSDFLFANRWVRNYLPHAWALMYRRVKRERSRGSWTGAVWRSIMGRLIEPVVRRAQLSYMRVRRTTEVIRPGMLRFHPRDARVWVKKKYSAALKMYNIPLDNIFYHR